MNLEMTVDSLVSPAAKDFLAATVGMYFVTVTRKGDCWVLCAEYLGY